MTRIALMRHFPTLWNLEGRIQGQTDIPLTPEAIEKLGQLGIPDPWNNALLIASPLSRAAETARQLAHGKSIRYEERLKEIAYGDWEGKRGVDLLADPTSGYGHVEDGGWHRTPPGGESHWQAWERVKPALAEIADQGEPALLITHRALMRAILARAWGWEFDCPEPFKIKRGRLYPLTLQEDGEPCDPDHPAVLRGY